MQKEVEEKRKKRDEKKAERSDVISEEISDLPPEETSVTQEEITDFSQEPHDVPDEKPMSKHLPEEIPLDEKDKHTEGAVEKTSTEQPAASEADQEEKEKKYAAYYYWPILPQEHYKRWEIENATM